MSFLLKFLHFSHLDCIARYLHRHVSYGLWKLSRTLQVSRIFGYFCADFEGNFSTNCVDSIRNLLLQVIHQHFWSFSHNFGDFIANFNWKQWLASCPSLYNHPSGIWASPSPRRAALPLNLNKHGNPKEGREKLPQVDDFVCDTACCLCPRLPRPSW